MFDLKKFKRVLSFFAHPDDETLAAGGTIAKLTRMGADVHVAIPATGIHSRRQIQSDGSMAAELQSLRRDCEVAMKILGIPPENIYLGDFPDNEMDQGTLLQVIHWLESLMEKINPELILTHHRFCTNIDHRYCHEAVVVASRPGLDRHMTVLCGEVPSSTGYLKPTNWEPNLFVQISREELDAKIQAMESYQGEARPDPHPRSREVLNALAKVRGSDSGFFFAESFMVQKIFA